MVSVELATAAALRPHTSCNEQAADDDYCPEETEEAPPHIAGSAVVHNMLAAAHAPDANSPFLSGPPPEHQSRNEKRRPQPQERALPTEKNISGRVIFVELASSTWKILKRWGRKTAKWMRKWLFKFFQLIHFIWFDVLSLMVGLGICALLLTKISIFRLRDRPFPVVFNSASEEWEGPIELSFPPFVPIETGYDWGSDPDLSVSLNGSSPLWKRMTATFFDSAQFVVSPEILFAGLNLGGFLIIAVMQIWVRDGWDFVAAHLGLSKGLVTILLMHTILVKFVGKMRPNFMGYCQPIIPPNLLPTESANSQFNRQWLTTGDCTCSKEDLVFALSSFPSGHTASSFCTGVYLSLYLNGKLKAFSDYHTAFWKMMLVLAPIGGACFVAGSLLIDNNHSFDDVLQTIPMGVYIALLAYRSHYISIFNYANNHLYLPLSSSRLGFSHREHHISIDPAEYEKKTFRFRYFKNSAAVAWPRNRHMQKPYINDQRSQPQASRNFLSRFREQEHRHSDLHDSDFRGSRDGALSLVYGGADGTTDNDRPFVSGSMRRRRGVLFERQASSKGEGEPSQKPPQETPAGADDQWEGTAAHVTVASDGREGRLGKHMPSEGSGQNSNLPTAQESGPWSSTKYVVPGSFPDIGFLSFSGRVGTPNSEQLVRLPVRSLAQLREKSVRKGIRDAKRSAGMMV